MNHDIRLGVNYADASTRGRIRAWKAKLARNYAQFNTGYEQSEPLVVDMIKSSRSGRERAFARIKQAFGPGAILESANLGRNEKSRAIWSILKPRGAVAVIDALPDDIPESTRGSMAQDCVTVNYIFVGCLGGMAIKAEGGWTLEVPDHALGRAVEYSGLLQPETIIRDAHRNLLDLPMTLADDENFTNPKSNGVYIKAGAGCFAGHLVVAPDQSTGYDLSVHVRVKTWIDDNRLRDDQVVLCEKGESGKRLGDSWLKPRPLVRIEQAASGHLQVYVR